MIVREDVLAGTLTVAVGISGIAIVVSSYPIGRLTAMGPGFMPLVACSALAILGAIQLITQGLVSKGRALIIQWRPLAVITLSVVVFALLIQRGGLAVAVAACVLISSFATSRFQWASALWLAAGLALGSVGLFIYALGLPLRAWPF